MGDLRTRWADERKAILDAVAEDDRDQVAALLDRALARAIASDLKGAAASLQQVRDWAISRNLYRSWDNGIWVFSSIIELLRQMSNEANAPRAYQRLIDAIPSAKSEDEMTRAQLAFWYGAHSSASPRGEIWISAAALAGIGLLLWYFT